MKERAKLDAANLIAAELHLFGDPARKRRDPCRVAAGVRVARVDGRGKRAHRCEVELAHARECLCVLESGRDEIRQRLKDRDVLVVQTVWDVRCAGEDADKLSTALHRQVHLAFHAARLAALEHPACRSRPDRNAYPCRGLVTVRVDHELELVASLVVSRDRERIASHERRGCVKCEPRDIERLMHRSELPRENVQGGEPPDPAFALAALVCGAKCA